MRQILRTALSVLAIIGIATFPGFAQDPDSDADSPETQGEVLGEITVTARHAEENVQDIPTPISVITSSELETKQVLNTRDLQEVVPNVVFERNTGTSSGAKIFMRGVGTDESLFTADPAVGIYIDGVYIPRQTGASFELFDLERVEVLRGPQGTLYGRNTSGGAIKLYTSVPTKDRDVKVRLSAGSDSELVGDFYFAGGTDSARAGVALFSRTRDGYSRDLVNGRDVNDQDTLGLRAKFDFGTSDSSTRRFSVDHVRERSTAGFASSKLFNDDNDLYTLESGLDDKNDLDQSGASFRYGRVLEEWEFVSTTAYREMENLLLLDADGTPIPRFHLSQDQQQEQLSQEIQLLSTSGGDVEWQFGLFYFAEDNEQPTQNIIFAPGSINNIQQETSSYAAYGQVNYRTGSLLLTGGLRYSSEDKDFRVDSVLGDGVTPNFTFVANDSWSQLDYRAEIAYRASEKAMVYGTLATGFKSGGFNGRGGNPAALASFDQEEVTNYEIGVKTDLADNKVRLNANYYFNQYDNLQFTVLDEFGVFRTINAADTEVQGIELDLRAILAPRFELTANVGTIDDKYKGTVPTFDASQLELKQAPDLTWGLGLQYTWLTDAGYVTANASASFTDDHFQNVANSPVIATDAYTMVDARVSYGPNSGKWDVFAYGRNITDEEYTTGGFDIGVLGIGVVYLNRPANYGAGFSVRF